MTRTIELHLIQTLPPSRVNRGEDGSPKSITLGGVPRVRVSSQSIKRAQRTGHPSTIGAVRTKKPHSEVAKLLDEVDGDTLMVIMDVMEAQYGGYDESGRLKTMVMLGRDEIERFAQVIEAKLDQLLPLRTQISALEMEMKQAREDGAKAKALKDMEASGAAVRAEYDSLIHTMRRDLKAQTESADIALYGRFLAEDKSWSVEAATSYGHAFSVGRAQVTADFFSAVDDVDGGVSAHIGTSDHAAPTLYRMAVLDLDQLERNLKTKDIEAAVRNWIQGFLYATPTGGQHGAFARTLPEYVMMMARQGGHPVSYANAFAEPVYPESGQTLIRSAVQRLKDFTQKQQELYGDNGAVKVLEMTTIAGIDVEQTPLEEAQQAALNFLEV